MTTMDVQAELTNRLITKGKAGNPSLTLYNFDFSRINLSTQSVAFENVAATAIAPRTVDQDSYKNCTSVAVKVTFTLEERATKSFEWSLEGGLSWSSGLTATIEIPEVGNISGQRSVEVTLGGSVRGATTEERTRTRSHEVEVPPCREIREVMFLSETEHSGDIVVTVLATGTASAYMDVDWAIDPKVEVAVNETFEVRGKFKAVGGQNWTVELVETPAICPPGSACNPSDERDRESKPRPDPSRPPHPGGGALPTGAGSGTAHPPDRKTR